MIKYCVLLFFCLLISQSAMSSTYLSWFSDATISEMTSKLGKPAGAPPATTSGGIIRIGRGCVLQLPDKITSGGGAKGKGVNLTNFPGVTFAVPSMSNTARGMISFWIKPTQDGKLTSGGIDHVLLTSGSPDATHSPNGLKITWNNATGTLRFKMANSRVTVCRADISSWKANDWHHVQVAWKDNNASTPIGLAVWIDKVAVASCIYGGTAFMTPPSGNNVTLGSSTASCYMDELMFRDFDGDCGNMMPMAYRDYYRTAPYTSIQITNMPNQVAGDTWVLAGKKKQFGLIATRLLNTTSGATTTEYLADFNKRYNPWGDFDAKPYITWSITGGTGATVDANGLVTGGSSAVTRTLNASFAGLTAPTYSLVVRPWTGTGNTKPDLGIMYVSRTPRYERNAAKEWPAAGDIVTTTVYFGNFGTKAATGFTVKIEKATDANNNFKVDANETFSLVGTAQTVSSLAMGATMSVSRTWKWPANGLTTGSVFIRVTLDSVGAQTEICEANNVRTEKSNAKAFQWGWHSWFTDDYNNKVVNLVGSFSDYDWQNAEVDRVALLMRESIYPSTTANGILDSIRVDDYSNSTNPPIDSHYFDGGYGGCEPLNGATQMHFDNAVGHEICHTTLGQPDLYGQSTEVDNCFVKDSNGNYYAGTAIYPITWASFICAPYSSATFDYPDQLGVGYDVIMCGCHFGVMGRAMAGLTQFKRQAREDLSEDFWGDFGEWIPTTNRLRLFDINDSALANARVYAYQMICTGRWYEYGNRYYSDRPKFIMATDSSGYCTIPTTTSRYWDDWNTDAIEKAVPVSTPFGVDGRKYSLVPSGGAGDVLLLRVIGANGQVEFHLLPMTEFNAAYFAGYTGTATYPIRTSLTSPASTPAFAAPIDAAGGQAPIARMSYNGVTYDTDSEILVPAGTNLTFYATVSSDPEGFTPLRYRWNCSDGAYSSGTSLSINTIGWSVGDTYDAGLMVIDGVRYSETLTITIRIASPNLVSGTVTNSSGDPVGGAIVGFKTSQRATADANAYAVTNGAGSYAIDGLSGAYYVAAWGDGYTPCADSTITAGSGPVTKNLQLTQTEGTNLCLSATDVWATSENTSESLWADLSADGNLDTRWGSDYGVEDCTWYVDFGTSRSVRAATIYWEWSRPSAYSIDYTTGDPHNGGSTWTTAYSTTQGDGYWLSDNYHLDPIRFASPITARGMRVHCTQFLNSIIQSAWEFEFHAN